MILFVKKWWLGLLAIVVILSGAVVITLTGWPTATPEVPPQIAEPMSIPDNIEKVAQINSDPNIEASVAEVSATEVPATEAPVLKSTPNEAEPFVPNNAAGKSNRLINEKSPYLLQHADNPVDWHPWGEEAFEKARRENKPIFLSIGYSTCHWCHVMEEESFEDSEVARLMNETFVPIMVDREERPDIDSYYMNVAVMLTGSGGWPLNVILTPDRKPFFASTYIPKETRFGRLGLLELIPSVQEAWLNQDAGLLDAADQAMAALDQISNSSKAGELAMDEALLEIAYQQFADSFDAQNGGFGGAPKFPSPHNLIFLLRYWERTGDQTALEMVETNLQAMRRGGMYDQVGLGFHRYSTDAAWLVPHFEKMLYDQALLALAYTEAYQATGNPEYEQTAREIFTYVLRDMTAPTGGFFSAEDADSEGEEGKFYVWTADEIRQTLDEAEADLIIAAFNVTEAGNFIDPIQGEPVGTNILYLAKSLSELAEDLQMSEQTLAERLEAARAQLFATREARIHPHKDDKILTDWNGLMIAALAKGGRVFGDARYTEAAEQAANFILREMRDENGRLLHRYRDGEALLLANVDDYASLTWGLLELYETDFDIRYLETALNLTDELLAHFWDDEDGGLYLTPDDGENLLSRQKKIGDTDIPSGNSVAMFNLLRLGRIMARADLEEKAVAIGHAFAGYIGQQPSAYGLLMVAVNFGVGPSYEVVIVGEAEAEDTQAMLAALRSKFVPNKVVLLRPPGKAPEIVRLAEFAKYHSSLNGQATAYVCLNYYCELPTTDIDEMLALLGKT
ncbi:thioredoxin domain-containing protein [Chloroflexota bacterium]